MRQIFGIISISKRNINSLLIHKTSRSVVPWTRTKEIRALLKIYQSKDCRQNAIDFPRFHSSFLPDQYETQRNPYDLSLYHDRSKSFRYCIIIIQSIQSSFSISLFFFSVRSSNIRPSILSKGFLTSFLLCPPSLIVVFSSCYRITAKIDDDMIRYYVDEDLFLLEVTHSRVPNPDPSNERNPANPGSPGDPGDPSDQPATAGYDVTLIELPSASAHIAHSPLNSAHGHAHVHESGNTWTFRAAERSTKKMKKNGCNYIVRGFRRFV